MLTDIYPDFREGEEVIAFDGDNKEICRGPLMSIQKERYGFYTVVIGEHTIDRISTYSKSFIVNAQRFGQALDNAFLKRLSSVNDASLGYAMDELTDDERLRVDSHLRDLHCILVRAAYRSDERREEGRGLSFKMAQSMHGNSEIKIPEIERSSFDRTVAYSTSDFFKALEKMKRDADGLVIFKKQEGGE